MEFYCQAFVDAVDNWGFAEVPPIAKYIPAIEGYEDTFSNWETRGRASTPFRSSAGISCVTRTPPSPMFPTCARPSIIRCT